jgi:hypothetical protein
VGEAVIGGTVQRRAGGVCAVLAVLAAGIVALPAAPAAAAIDATGTARCKMRGQVTFTPPITNTPRNNVVVSFDGRLECPLATTGIDGVHAKRAILRIVSQPGRLSCTSTTFPPLTAAAFWRTNRGVAINPTVVEWPSPVGDRMAREGLRLQVGAGKVSGSYGGQDNWLKFIARRPAIENCATPGGLTGYRVLPRENPIAFSVGTCGIGLAPPATYEHVVVFQFQNRTWDQVGGVNFDQMPYLHSLASSCSRFRDFTEADPQQGSAVQNVAQVTGAVQPNVRQNCVPSTSCFSTADNIFRQLRVRGRTAVNYVEGTTRPCQPAVGYVQIPPHDKWPHWVPYLYFTGADDKAFCNTHVRPYSEFNPNVLPAFSFITATECNLGHFPDPACGNATVDRWARANISRVLNTAKYRAGKIAVFVWYDEQSPAANLQITPSARTGVNGAKGHGFASTLKAWQSMLGIPCLARACFAPDMRTAARL